MGDIFVRLVPLHGSVRGFTVPDKNGDYNVYLRESLAPDVLEDTLQHELLHIARNDFQSDLPEDVLEAQVRDQTNKKRPTPDGNQM